jgi:hypothetical protein
MVQEETDQWCIQIFDLELRGDFAESFFGELQKQAKAIAISRDGVRAHCPLAKQAIGKVAGNGYWATQVRVMKREVMAWSAEAEDKHAEAVVLMREAADEEDSIEKLPVTPGPIIPAREQLGYLLLEQNQPSLASKEFETALTNAPGRRGALQGAVQASELSRQK